MKLSSNRPCQVICCCSACQLVVNTAAERINRRSVYMVMSHVLSAYAFTAVIKGPLGAQLVRPGPHFIVGRSHLVPVSALSPLQSAEPSLHESQMFQRPGCSPWLPERWDSYHRINENIREWGEEARRRARSLQRFRIFCLSILFNYRLLLWELRPPSHCLVETAPVFKIRSRHGARLILENDVAAFVSRLSHMH